MLRKAHLTEFGHHLLYPSEQLVEEDNMGRYTWSDAYLVGHEMIDLQHRSLLGMMNELADLEEGPGEVSPVAFDVLLAKIANYAVFHFDCEEALMRESGYVGMDDHFKLHQGFKDRVARYQKDFESGKIQLKDLVDFLSGWLIHHIARADRELSKTLAGKKPAL